MPTQRKSQPSSMIDRIAQGNAPRLSVSTSIYSVGSRAWLVPNDIRRGCGIRAGLGRLAVIGHCRLRGLESANAECEHQSSGKNGKQFGHGLSPDRSGRSSLAVSVIQKIGS